MWSGSSCLASHSAYKYISSEVLTKHLSTMVVYLCDTLDRNCTFITKKNIYTMTWLCIKCNRGHGVSCGVSWAVFCTFFWNEYLCCCSDNPEFSSDYKLRSLNNNELITDLTITFFVGKDLVKWASFLKTAIGLKVENFTGRGQYMIHAIQSHQYS